MKKATVRFLLNILPLFILAVSFFIPCIIAMEQKLPINKWVEISSYEVDLDGDQTIEKVKVLSDTIQQNGLIYWNDSQWWRVIVIDNNKEIVLYENYITLGCIYIIIGNSEPEQTKSIFLIRDDDYSFLTIKYQFDKSKNIYRRTDVLHIKKSALSGLPMPKN